MIDEKEKEIHTLKTIINKLQHRVVAFEQEKKGNRYFEVEYSNHPDPEHWVSWGVSSIYLEDLESILETVNNRCIDNDNSYFKTIKYFRIVEKIKETTRVVKTIENDYCTLTLEEYLKNSKPMKQWPKRGTKVTFKGTTQPFWFTNILKDANELLEIGKEYTITKIELASSWCAVIIDEFPDKKFSLSWFDYEKELTTKEATQLERDAWNTVKYEFVSLEELRDRKNV
jgi:hypothetical protein